MRPCAGDSFALQYSVVGELPITANITEVADAAGRTAYRAVYRAACHAVVVLLVVLLVVPLVMLLVVPLVMLLIAAVVLIVVGMAGMVVLVGSFGEKLRFQMLPILSRLLICGYCWWIYVSRFRIHCEVTIRLTAGDGKHLTIPAAVVRHQAMLTQELSNENGALVTKSNEING